MKRIFAILSFAFIWQWLRYCSPRCPHCAAGRLLRLAGPLRRLDGKLQRRTCDACLH